MCVVVVSFFVVLLCYSCVHVHHSAITSPTTTITPTTTTTPYTQVEVQQHVAALFQKLSAVATASAAKVHEMHAALHTAELDAEQLKQEILTRNAQAEKNGTLCLWYLFFFVFYFLNACYRCQILAISVVISSCCYQLSLIVSDDLYLSVPSHISPPTSPLPHLPSHISLLISNHISPLISNHISPPTSPLSFPMTPPLPHLPSHFQSHLPSHFQSHLPSHISPLISNDTSPPTSPLSFPTQMQGTVWYRHSS